MAAEGNYLRCPQCRLRIRASVWQIFGEQPGDCPRCTGMRSETVPLEWEPAAASRSRRSVADQTAWPQPASSVSRIEERLER